MEIIKINNNAPELSGGTYISLGYFDGVHLGHASLIGKCVSDAAGNSFASVVFTFRSITFKGRRILSQTEREELLSSLHPDYIVYASFDDMKNMSASDFVFFLKNELFCHKVYCGEDYSFGVNRSGNPAVLKKLCDENGIGCFITPDMKLDGESISTSRLKEALAQGDMKYFHKACGRYYTLHGKVEKGKGLGHIALLPTANITPGEGKAKPKMGVYLSEAYTGSEKYLSVTDYGVRPSVEKDGGERFETFLIGYEGDSLYGKEIEIRLISFMREEKKFDSLEKLNEQIESDVSEAVRIAKGGPEND